MLWNFYHVWVSKVSGPAFETNGSGANEMTVTFQFMDCDMPFFAGNSQFESSKWTGISGSAFDLCGQQQQAFPQL